MKTNSVTINIENLEQYLEFEIEGYDYFPYSDLSEYEIETILENISEGKTSGSFYTLSGKTDDEVLLTWRVTT